MAGQGKFEIGEDMAGLPDDKHLALVVFEARLRAKTRESDYKDASTHLDREYVNNILAFIELKELDIPVDHMPPTNDGEFWHWYTRFQQVLDYHLVKFRLAHARGLQDRVATALHLTADTRFSPSPATLGTSASLAYHREIK